MKILKNGRNNFGKNREKDLAKNALIMSVGKAGPALISFFLLPIYTAYLPKDAYGRVELLNTYVSLGTLFITLQVEQGCFRFLIEYRNDSIKVQNLISTALTGFITQLIFGAAILYVIVRFLHMEYGILFWGNCITNTVVVYFQQIVRGTGKSKVYVISGIIISCLNMGISCLNVIVLHQGVEGLLLAASIAYSLASIYLFFYIKTRILRFDFQLYCQLLKYSFPLILNSISWWIFNVSDRTLIKIFLGDASNGIYSIANKFSGICITFYGFFNLAWTETVAKAIDDSDREVFLSKTLAQMSNLFMTMILAIIAIMPIAFEILINPAFDDAYAQIPILLISAFFNCQSAQIGSIFIALKKTKEISVTSVAAAIMNLILNYLFIKSYGLYAASLSTAFSYLLLYLYRIYKIKRDILLTISYKAVAFQLLLVLLCIALYFMRSTAAMLINIAIVCLYGILSNRHLLPILQQKK